MENFEDERSHNEFEIEFTDLPAGEKKSRASLLLVEGAHFLHVLHIPTVVRSRLLSISPRNDTLDQGEDESFEIEISDLPPGDDHPGSGELPLFSATASLRAHLRRSFIIACTFLMVLMFVFRAFPSLPDNVSGLFVRPTPVPTTTVNYSQWTSVRAITELTPGVIIVGQKPVNTSANTTVAPGTTVWATNILPGPPPQAKDCSARPINGYSHQVGSAPIWATGFSGPLATLHLYPSPVSVPAFPNTFGWTASILFDAPRDYPDHITLNGAGIHSGSPLLFQLDSTQDPLAFLILDPSQFPGNQGNTADPTVSWSVTMYFPAAGCYFLTASWPGGHWIINFAAGQ